MSYHVDFRIGMESIAREKSLSEKTSKKGEKPLSLQAGCFLRTQTHFERNSSKRKPFKVSKPEKILNVKISGILQTMLDKLGIDETEKSVDSSVLVLHECDSGYKIVCKTLTSCIGNTQYPQEHMGKFAVEKKEKITTPECSRRWSTRKEF
jgi:hypothetical protein